MDALRQHAARVSTFKTLPQHWKRCWQLPGPQIFFTVPERILKSKEDKALIELCLENTPNKQNQKEIQ